MKYIVVAHFGVQRALLINKIDEQETDVILLKPLKIEHIRLVQDIVLDLANAHVAE